jgi:hemerythrin superfamily protein
MYAIKQTDIEHRDTIKFPIKKVSFWNAQACPRFFAAVPDRDSTQVRRKMNAIELLKADHKVVEDLFKKIESTEDGEHPKLFVRIKGELDVHAHIEETIFYPKLLADGDESLQDIVKEGIEEHRQMKMFLKEIDSLADDSEKFEPKLKVLMEDTRHHVKEEEEEMFPKTEKQFESDTLDELGAGMEAEKKAVGKSAAGAGS